jgi:4-hydroxy-tetrahydrodipicolinate reductase
MSQTRTGLFGFGRTGKIVAAELLNDSDFALGWVVRRRRHENEPPFASQALNRPDPPSAPFFAKSDVTPAFFDTHPVDVLIDFSDKTGYRSYAAAAERGVKIVSAISAYDDAALETLHRYAEKTAVLVSPNITVGINFLMVAAQMLQKIVPYADIEIVEEHFREKQETSGTALKIANALELDAETQVNSVRVGGIVGKHQVIFGLRNQTIRLTHESISKAAFGQGAIFAAGWLADKPPGYYTMDKVIADLMMAHLRDEPDESDAESGLVCE